MNRPKRTLLLALVASLSLASCAALYQPVVDYAVDQAIAKAEEGLKDVAKDFVVDMAAKPAPQMPPPGAGFTEWAVYGGMVLLGSVAVLIDRRWFHKKRSCTNGVVH